MGTGSHRYRVTLDSGNFFYLAAIWDPPCADWPLSYRILTIPAGADVIPYQSRHGVIIERRNVMHWLDGTLPPEELFLEPPRHTLFVEQLRAQASSDEHTSELQSLMRISYAVICLKENNTNNKKTERK